MSARVTRVREFRLALIEVEATKIRAAGTGSHEVGAAENATDDIARGYMRGPSSSCQARALRTKGVVVVPTRDPHLYNCRGGIMLAEHGFDPAFRDHLP